MKDRISRQPLGGRREVKSRLNIPADRASFSDFCDPDPGRPPNRPAARSAAKIFWGRNTAEHPTDRPYSDRPEARKRSGWSNFVFPDLLFGELALDLVGTPDRPTQFAQELGRLF